MGQPVFQATERTISDLDSPNSNSRTFKEFGVGVLSGLAELLEGRLNPTEAQAAQFEFVSSERVPSATVFTPMALVVTAGVVGLTLAGLFYLFVRRRRR